MAISSKLSDNEIIQKILDNEIKLRELSELGEKRATALRRQFLEKKFNIDLESLDAVKTNPEFCKANIENMIGTTKIPLGIAGPVKVKGEYADDEYFLPLATTEGALVASVNRGCSVINKSGGCSTLLLQNLQTRSILFKADSLKHVRTFLKWLNENNSKLIETGNSTDEHICVLEIRPYVTGLNVWLRIKADTDDAMGMNMVTIAGKKIAEFVLENFDIEFISESGNMCVDKKPSALNLIEGRGKKVIASVDIPEKVIENVLKTTSEKLIDLNYRKNLLGSASSFSLGYNAHFANIIAAMYIATGQDPAQVVSGSMGITTVEKSNSGVNFSVTLPSIQCGIIGGGTNLSSQNKSLEILNVKSSKELAEIISAAVLAGEISLLAALCTKELSSAHVKHNR